jgi:hypothetical protein
LNQKLIQINSVVRSKPFQRSEFSEDSVENLNLLALPLLGDFFIFHLIGNGHLQGVCCKSGAL